MGEHVQHDQALGDTTPPADHTATSHVAHQPLDDAAIHGTEPLTISQILDMAKLPERRVRICLAGDLQARYDQIMAELGPLVTGDGELLVDAEASIGEQTAAVRAQHLTDELEQVRAEMAARTTMFHFRGMSADDLAVFEKTFKPKNPEADHTDYWVRLIAKSAVQPAMAESDVRTFRQRLGSNAFLQLVKGAREVNLGGGVDVPKSLNFSLVRPGN